MNNLHSIYSAYMHLILTERKRERERALQYCSTFIDAFIAFIHSLRSLLMMYIKLIPM